MPPSECYRKGWYRCLNFLKNNGLTFFNKFQGLFYFPVILFLHPTPLLQQLQQHPKRGNRLLPLQSFKYRAFLQRKIPHISIWKKNSCLSNLATEDSLNFLIFLLLGKGYVHSTAQNHRIKLIFFPMEARATQVLSRLEDTRGKCWLADSKVAAAKVHPLSLQEFSLTELKGNSQKGSWPSCHSLDYTIISLVNPDQPAFVCFVPCFFVIFSHFFVLSLNFLGGGGRGLKTKMLKYSISFVAVNLDWHRLI